MGAGSIAALCAGRIEGCEVKEFQLKPEWLPGRFDAFDVADLFLNAHAAWIYTQGNSLFLYRNEARQIILNWLLESAEPDDLNDPFCHAFDMAHVLEKFREYLGEVFEPFQK